MTDNLKGRFGGSSIYVLFYGVFIMVMLILQCVIPFYQDYAQQLNIDHWWAALLNGKFSLPIENMAYFWVAICSVYIGVERGTAIIAQFTGSDDLPEVSNRDHLKQIILLSFIIFMEAVLLGLLFDRELGLTSFSAAFGSSMLLYVAGTKAMKGAKDLSKEEIVETTI